MKSRPSILILGDAAVLALTTLIGFANHGDWAGAGWRYLATFIPLLAGWLGAAWLAGGLDPAAALGGRQIGRAAAAMIFAVPAAAWLRGALLARPVEPVFVLVLIAVNVAAILAWRAVYAWSARRKLTHG
jgi:hypothetical protein